MAKSDFCFTYYDGDATRDMSHLTRLQRGAYSDIVIAIRKFGHLSIEQVKMILSKDFDECWPPIKMIMLCDESGNFFLEWLESSLKKAAAHSEKQKKNVSNRYKNLPNEDLVLPKTDLVIPLGDGNGDGNENVFVGKGVQGENQFPKPEDVGELPQVMAETAIRRLKTQTQQTVAYSLVIEMWEIFKTQNLTGKKFYADVGDVHNHFINWFVKQKFDHGSSKTRQQQTSESIAHIKRKGTELFNKIAAERNQT